MPLFGHHTRLNYIYMYTYIYLQILNSLRKLQILNFENFSEQEYVPPVLMSYNIRRDYKMF
jgi:hypothetical protein